MVLYMACSSRVPHWNARQIVISSNGRQWKEMTWRSKTVRTSIRMSPGSIVNPNSWESHWVLLNPQTLVSRAKWRMLKKCSPEIQVTATVSYPKRRTPSVYHKKGRPSAATFHKSRPGNPSFCIFGLPHRGSPRTAVGQITRKYRAWQALGIIS